MGYAKEVIRVWYGVELPEWLRAFDCRAENKDIAPEAPWTNMYGKVILWGSERAEVDLGLRSREESHGTTPISCQTYLDARKASESELRSQVLDMVSSAWRLRREWLSAKEHQAAPGEGGGCCYQPVAICMSNFGWSIICDRRTQVVRRFGG